MFDQTSVSESSAASPAVTGEAISSTNAAISSDTTDTLDSDYSIETSDIPVTRESLQADQAKNPDLPESEKQNQDATKQPELTPESVGLKNLRTAYETSKKEFESFKQTVTPYQETVNNLGGLEALQMYAPVLSSLANPQADPIDVLASLKEAAPYHYPAMAEAIVSDPTNRDYLLQQAFGTGFTFDKLSELAQLEKDGKITREDVDEWMPEEAKERLTRAEREAREAKEAASRFEKMQAEIKEQQLAAQFQKVSQEFTQELGRPVLELKTKYGLEPTPNDTPDEAARKTDFASILDLQAQALFTTNPKAAQLAANIEDLVKKGHEAHARIFLAQLKGMMSEHVSKTAQRFERYIRADREHSKSQVTTPQGIRPEISGTGTSSGVGAQSSGKSTKDLYAGLTPGSEAWLAVSERVMTDKLRSQGINV